MKIYSTIARSTFMTTVVLTCGHRLNVENETYKKEIRRANKKAIAKQKEKKLHKKPELEMEFKCRTCNIDSIPSNTEPVMLSTETSEIATTNTTELSE